MAIDGQNNLPKGVKHLLRLWMVVITLLQAFCNLLLHPSRTDCKSLVIKVTAKDGVKLESAFLGNAMGSVVL